MSGCSNVTFLSATPGGAYPGNVEDPDDIDDIPNDTMYVVRSARRSGQLERDYDIDSVRAAKMFLHNNSSLTSSYRVDILVKHEAGHSFGIANGQSSDPPSYYVAKYD